MGFTWGGKRWNNTINSGQTNKLLPGNKRFPCSKIIAPVVPAGCYFSTSAGRTLSAGICGERQLLGPPMRSRLGCLIKYRVDRVQNKPVSLKHSSGKKKQILFLFGEKSTGAAANISEMLLPVEAFLTQTQAFMCHLMVASILKAFL